MEFGSLEKRRTSKDVCYTLLLEMLNEYEFVPILYHAFFEYKLHHCKCNNTLFLQSKRFRSIALLVVCICNNAVLMESQNDLVRRIFPMYPHKYSVLVNKHIDNPNLLECESISYVKSSAFGSMFFIHAFRILLKQLDNQEYKRFFLFHH